jgi:ankyrin repeat protein
MQVLKLLTSCYPEGISTKTDLGHLPIHLAAIFNASAEVINVLLSAYPEGLLVMDHNGYLPIHTECMNMPVQIRSSPIISKCIEQYPETLSMADRSGSLPLHRLLQNVISSTDDLLIMIEKHPAVLRHQNNDGYLPLHFECSNKRRSSIISKCIQLYPESLNVNTGAGDIPWTLALRNVSSKNIYELRESLFLLLSACPASFYHPLHDPLVNKLPN